MRKNDDAALCSVTLYWEKKRDLIDGSVWGKGRDAYDEEVSGGVSSGRMMMPKPPRSMALSPAGESGTIDGS